VFRVKLFCIAGLRALGSEALGKVVTQSELIVQRHEWKRNGRRVVLVSGCFDLLHPGHIRLLEQARSLGDVLVVALESDASVRARNDAAGKPSKGVNRGPSRPITSAAERAEILAALACVDYIFEISEAGASEFLAEIAPDILVTGGSAAPGKDVVVEERSAQAAGARIVRIPLEPGYSTTRLVERIQQLRA
jgi:D-glycero-beta-D-manno-heptose 1-phosphate adenylyltransferase